MIKNELAEKRKNWQGKGLTLAQLAQKVGISRSYVCKLEQNRRKPSGDVMLRIAKCLNCRVEDIFRIEDDIEKG